MKELKNIESVIPTLLRIIQDLNLEGRKYIVRLVNLFNSERLLLFLLKEDIGAAGTVRKQERKGIPSKILDLKFHNKIAIL